MVVSHGKTGQLFLTTSYVLFDSYFGGGVDQPYQIAIPLEDVTAIKRTKHVLYEEVEINAKGEVSPD